MEALMEKNRREGSNLESDGSDWSAMASSRTKPTHPKRLRAVFDIFDKDGSGSISADELEWVTRRLNINLEKEQLDALMLEVRPSAPPPCPSSRRS